MHSVYNGSAIENRRWRSRTNPKLNILLVRWNEPTNQRNNERTKSAAVHPFLKTNSTHYYRQFLYNMDMASSHLISSHHLLPFLIFASSACCSGVSTFLAAEGGLLLLFLSDAAAASAEAVVAPPPIPPALLLLLAVLVGSCVFLLLLVLPQPKKLNTEADQLLLPPPEEEAVVPPDARVLDAVARTAAFTGMVGSATLPGAAMGTAGAAAAARNAL
jgi:hypothetical protein